MDDSDKPKGLLHFSVRWPEAETKSQLSLSTNIGLGLKLLAVTNTQACYAVILLTDVKCFKEQVPDKL